MKIVKYNVDVKPSFIRAIRIAADIRVSNNLYLKELILRGADIQCMTIYQLIRYNYYDEAKLAINNGNCRNAFLYSCAVGAIDMLENIYQYIYQYCDHEITNIL